MRPDDDTRARLAVAQAALLASLLDATPPPPGFDGTRLAATGLGLASKRIRSAGHAWPGLAVAMGVDFAIRFRDFADAHPQLAGASALEDGLGFADWLAAAGQLPARGEMERCAVRLRHRVRDGRLLARDGFALQLARLGPCSWLLAIRLPGGREWWWQGPRRPG